MIWYVINRVITNDMTGIIRVMEVIVAPAKIVNQIKYC
jgi:hypothetical protein